MIYFWFIHSYINYGNFSWASTSQTELTKQKLSVRNIFCEEKEAQARPLLKEIYVLNVYQVNILRILTFTQKVKNYNISRVFLNTFEEVEHNYPTRFSKCNLKQPPAFINYAKFLWTTIIE